MIYCYTIPCVPGQTLWPRLRSNFPMHLVGLYNNALPSVRQRVNKAGEDTK